MNNQNEDLDKSSNQLNLNIVQPQIEETISNFEENPQSLQQTSDEESVANQASPIEQQIREARKEEANKDMLYGALWCVGGIAATVADFGYVFWGAIVFGGIQFFKGLMNSNNN